VIGASFLLYFFLSLSFYLYIDLFALSNHHSARNIYYWTPNRTCLAKKLKYWVHSLCQFIGSLWITQSKKVISLRWLEEEHLIWNQQRLKNKKTCFSLFLCRFFILYFTLFCIWFLFILFWFWVAVGGYTLLLLAVTRPKQVVKSFVFQQATTTWKTTTSGSNNNNTQAIKLPRT